MLEIAAGIILAFVILAFLPEVLEFLGGCLAFVILTGLGVGSVYLTVRLADTHPTFVVAVLSALVAAAITYKVRTGRVRSGAIHASLEDSAPENESLVGMSEETMVGRLTAMKEDVEGRPSVEDVFEAALHSERKRTADELTAKRRADEATAERAQVVASIATAIQPILIERATLDDWKIKVRWEPGKESLRLQVKSKDDEGNWHWGRPYIDLWYRPITWLTDDLDLKLEAVPSEGGDARRGLDREVAVQTLIAWVAASVAREQARRETNYQRTGEK